MEIKILDPLTASKIAAGEVVEKPLNVVKELVENALDAKASKILVEITDGGAEMIRITDNGCGIHYDDLTNALERFATSKAVSVEDVYNISSYGFRGEALAAVSAVSDFSLKSVRDGGDAGEVVSKFGDVHPVKPVAISKGTQVTVLKIFDNLPVRKKFLKSNKSSELEILRFIKQLSFHNSGIEFIFKADNKELYRTYPADTMLDIAKKVSGEDNMVYHEYMNKDICIKVCTSNPLIQRKRRDGILLGVNGRVIKDPSLVQAVVQGYHRVLPANVYPYSFIDIKMLPAAVDVNVHPTKSEVRFESPQHIFYAVRSAVEESLNKFSQVKYETVDTSALLTDDSESNLTMKNTARESIQVKTEPYIKKTDYSEPKFKQEKVIPTFDITAHLESSTVDIAPVEAQIQQKQNVSLPKNDSLYKVIGQLKKTYIMCQSETGDLVIIDQHVAHERVLFEKYTAERMVAVPSVTLYEPIVIHMQDEEILFVRSMSDEMLKFGYCFEMFGSNDIKLVTVPVEILKKDAGKEFMDIINSAMELKRSRRGDYAVVTMSCKNAVKAGEELSIYEMQHLVDTLFKTANPYTCPHGRPIVFTMAAQDIDKKFQRQ